MILGKESDEQQRIEKMKRQKRNRSKKAKEKTLQLFEEVQLPRPEDIYNSYPHELSGGEQQRVGLARALINNPSLIIADEPTGNLDPKSSFEIMDLLDEINQRGTTVLVITHEKNIVDRMQKRVIEIDNGTIIRDEKKGLYKNENSDN